MIATMSSCIVLTEDLKVAGTGETGKGDVKGLITPGVVAEGTDLSEVTPGSAAGNGRATLDWGAFGGKFTERGGLGTGCPEGGMAGLGGCEASPAGAGAGGIGDLKESPDIFDDTGPGFGDVGISLMGRLGGSDD